MYLAWRKISRFHEQFLCIALCFLVLNRAQAVPAPYQDQSSDAEVANAIPAISERQALPLDDSKISSLEASIKSSSIATANQQESGGLPLDSIKQEEAFQNEPSDTKALVNGPHNEPFTETIDSSSKIPNAGVGVLNTGNKEDVIHPEAMQRSEIPGQNIPRNREDHLGIEYSLNEKMESSTGTDAVEATNVVEDGAKGTQSELGKEEHGFVDVTNNFDGGERVEGNTEIPGGHQNEGLISEVNGDIRAQDKRMRMIENNSANDQTEEFQSEGSAPISNDGTGTGSVPNAAGQTADIDIGSENFQHVIQEPGNDQLAEIPHDAKIAALPHDDAVSLNQIPGTVQEVTAHKEMTQETENQSLPNADSTYDANRIDSSDVSNIEPDSQSQGEQASTFEHVFESTSHSQIATDSTENNHMQFEQLSPVEHVAQSVPQLQVSLDSAENNHIEGEQGSSAQHVVEFAPQSQISTDPAENNHMQYEQLSPVEHVVESVPQPQASLDSAENNHIEGEQGSSAQHVVEFAPQSQISTDSVENNHIHDEQAPSVDHVAELPPQSQISTGSDETSHMQDDQASSVEHVGEFAPQSQASLDSAENNHIEGEQGSSARHVAELPPQSQISSDSVENNSMQYDQASPVEHVLELNPQPHISLDRAENSHLQEDEQESSGHLTPKSNIFTDPAEHNHLPSVGAEDQKVSTNSYNEVQHNTMQVIQSDHDQVHGGITDTGSSQTSESTTVQEEIQSTDENEDHQSANELQLDHQDHDYSGNTEIGRSETENSEAFHEVIQSTDDSSIRPVSVSQVDHAEDGKVVDTNDILNSNSIQDSVHEASEHYTDKRRITEHGDEHYQHKDDVGVHLDGSAATIENESIQNLENGIVMDATNERTPLLALGDTEKETSQSSGLFEKYATEREVNERSQEVETVGVHSVETEIEEGSQVVHQEESHGRQALERDPDQVWSNQPQHMYTGYTYRPLQSGQEQSSDSASAENENTHQEQQTAMDAPRHSLDVGEKYTASQDTLQLHHSADDGSLDHVSSEKEKHDPIIEELNPVPLSDYSDRDESVRNQMETVGGERELEAQAKKHQEITAKPYNIGSAIREAFHKFLVLLLLALVAKMGYKRFVANRSRRMYTRRQRNSLKLDV